MNVWAAAVCCLACYGEQHGLKVVHWLPGKNKWTYGSGTKVHYSEQYGLRSTCFLFLILHLAPLLLFSQFLKHLCYFFLMHLNLSSQTSFLPLELVETFILL